MCPQFTIFFYEPNEKQSNQWRCDAPRAERSRKKTYEIESECSLLQKQHLWFIS